MPKKNERFSSWRKVKPPTKNHSGPFKFLFLFIFLFYSHVSVPLTVHISFPIFLPSSSCSITHTCLRSCLPLCVCSSPPSFLSLAFVLCYSPCLLLDSSCLCCCFGLAVAGRLKFQRMQVPSSGSGCTISFRWQGPMTTSSSLRWVWRWHWAW